MKKIILPVILLIVILGFTAPGKKVSLFNGKDLTGWKIYGSEKWYVDNGLLVCESGPKKSMAIWLPRNSIKISILRLSFSRKATAIAAYSSVPQLKEPKYQAGSAKLHQRAMIQAAFMNLTAAAG